MKIAKIKPIPKYIEKLIRKKDGQCYKTPCGFTRFYAYLTKNDGELVKVTVAVRHKYKTWYCKQVAVHGIHSKLCFVKDLVFYRIAGYVVGWHDYGLSKTEKWFEDSEWGWAYDNELDPYAPIVNSEYAEKFDEYKYSVASQYGYVDLFKYLRLYEKYPSAEYLVKLGLSYLATSKQILHKANKDKAFRKWIGRNKDELTKPYYVCTILKSYAKNLPLAQVQKDEHRKKCFIREGNNKEIYKLFKDNLEQFSNYIKQQGTSVAAYRDYLNACLYLGLDMSLSKNRIPHEFRRWHDIRIDEYNTKRMIDDAEKRKELYEQFGRIAEKYLALQREGKDNYIVIIAKSPADLIAEGEALNHCVGRMNYDQRFVKEESLVFFVRDKNTPQIPLATVEYSLQRHKVLQCYGRNDNRPKQELLDFVNNTWLPYANKKLKKIAA